MEHLTRDLEALAAVPARFAGTQGERQMLDAVRQRLPAGLAPRAEGLVAHTSPAWFLALHAVLLLAAGVLGVWQPGWAGVATAALTASLVLEADGRGSPLRWPFPKHASYNLVARAVSEHSIGAVVFVAPLDVPRWRPDLPRWFRRRPVQGLISAGVVVTGSCLLRAIADETAAEEVHRVYIFALVVLGLAAGLSMLGNRRVPPRTSDTTGPAVVLELARRLSERPIPGVDTWFLFTGCGYAYQEGMRAFLACHAPHGSNPSAWSLRDPALVIGLHEPGRGSLAAVISEGPLRVEPHRPTGPALAERLRWAGVDLREGERPGATDANAATRHGLRALTLAGVGVPTVENTHRAAEIAETLARWYADDLHQVEQQRVALGGLRGEGA
jgi:hypothetical protein